jgi:hypothetical protein
MILFKKHTPSKDMLSMRLFEVRLAANISFKLCYTPSIPLTFELGLVFITISYEIWKA